MRILISFIGALIIGHSAYADCPDEAGKLPEGKGKRGKGGRPAIVLPNPGSAWGIYKGDANQAIAELGPRKKLELFVALKSGALPQDIPLAQSVRMVLANILGIPTPDVHFEKMMTVNDGWVKDTNIVLVRVVSNKAGFTKIQKHSEVAWYGTKIPSVDHPIIHAPNNIPPFNVIQRELYLALESLGQPGTAAPQNLTVEILVVPTRGGDSVLRLQQMIGRARIEISRDRYPSYSFRSPEGVLTLQRYTLKGSTRDLAAVLKAHARVFGQGKEIQWIGMEFPRDVDKLADIEFEFANDETAVFAFEWPHSFDEIWSQLELSQKISRALEQKREGVSVISEKDKLKLVNTAITPEGLRRIVEVEHIIHFKGRRQVVQESTIRIIFTLFQPNRSDRAVKTESIEIQN